MHVPQRLAPALWFAEQIPQTPFIFDVILPSSRLNLNLTSQHDRMDDLAPRIGDLER
jgi:hypothetical protein